MIKNREQLLSHGCVEGRRLALDIVEYSLREVDPYKATRDAVRYEDNGGLLRVKGDVFNLNDVINLYVVGAGKASYSIAKALDESAYNEQEKLCRFSVPTCQLKEDCTRPLNAYKP